MHCTIFVLDEIENKVTSDLEQVGPTGAAVTSDLEQVGPMGAASEE